MNQGVAGRKFARSGENTRPPKWPRLDSKLAPYPVPRGFCFVCFSGFTNWKKMQILDLLCNFGKRFSSPHGFGSIREANFRNFTMQSRIALISLSVQFKKEKKVMNHIPGILPSPFFRKATFVSFYLLNHCKFYTWNPRSATWGNHVY